MLSTLTAFLQALAAWFNYQRETDLEDRIEGKEDLLLRYQDEIDKLRSTGTPDDQQRADLLRLRHQAAKRSLKHLLARRSPVQAGDGGVDEGRDLHPPD